MSRIIELKTMHNVRDIGGTAGADGRKVREGLLFRGDQPYFASEDDLRTLVDAGVRKMIDFRSLAEHEEKPDPDIEGVKNIYLPVIKDVRVGITHGKKEDDVISKIIMNGLGADIDKVDSYLRDMYCQFINDDFSNKQYAAFVDEVLASAEAGQGVFWHCTAGKDRAGFATVILLESLGVSRDDIIADYLLTNERLRDFTFGLLEKMGDRLPTDEAKQAFVRFFSVHESYLGAAYELADSRYGSMSGYLEKALGVDASKRARLQALLLS